MDFVAEGKRMVETIRWTCNTLLVPELFAKITVEWNNRFTRKMGDANWKLNRVRFSVPLWPRASEDERRTTVIHEVCHLVANYKYKLFEKRGRRNPHGQEWKHLMKLCGIRPERCHNVDRTGLKRHNTRTKYKVYCECREWLVGPVRMKRMNSGARFYQGPHCHAPVTSRKPLNFVLLSMNPK